MKSSFRFIKRYFEADFYNIEKRSDYIIQKKGLFGWKTLIEVYDGNWSFHYSWSYFCSPGVCDTYDTFHSKKEALLFLKTYYRKIQPVLAVA